MKNKVLAIVSLTALIVFSCEETQLINPERNSQNAPGGKNVNSKLLFPNCNLADAVVQKMTITNVVGNTFDFTFLVVNQGLGTLHLNRMYFQPYLSEDALLDASDLPFRGSIFGETAPALAFGEKYSQDWFYNPITPVSLNKYNYLIVRVLVRPGFVMPECLLANNVAATRIIVIDIPRNGLVAFYPFNNNANDESGNNLNGVVNGATVTADRFGNAAKAYSFDGVDDFITMGNPVALQITNTITLSVWVSSATYILGANLLSKTRIPFGPYTNGYKLFLGESGDGTQFYSALIHFPDPGSGTTGNNFAGGVPFTTNEWINFTFTLDGQSAKWYKNGVETFSANNHLPLTSATLDNFEIGGLSGGLLNFNGLIDDVAVYNRALSANEVQQLYEQNISQ
jgi:Concanavalin A-like lectin/glucanases superfamily